MLRIYTQHILVRKTREQRRPVSHLLKVKSPRPEGFLLQYVSLCGRRPLGGIRHMMHKWNRVFKRKSSNHVQDCASMDTSSRFLLKAADCRNKKQQRHRLVDIAEPPVLLQLS